MRQALIRTNIGISYMPVSDIGSYLNLGNYMVIFNNIDPNLVIEQIFLLCRSRRRTGRRGLADVARSREPGNATEPLGCIAPSQGGAGVASTLVTPLTLVPLNPPPKVLIEGVSRVELGPGMFLTIALRTMLSINADSSQARHDRACCGTNLYK